GRKPHIHRRHPALRELLVRVAGVRDPCSGGRAAQRPAVVGHRMKICVLQSDYSTSDVDYQNYDPRRDLTLLLPGHTVDHVALNKLTTYRQLKQLARQGYDIFVNLCEG